MFCVLEKIGFDLIKVSNCSDIPETITYKWFFNYLKRMITKGNVLEELDFKDDIIYITRRFYNKTDSYLRKEKYMIDSTLKNDFRFMNELFGILNYYKTVRNIINLKIDKELDIVLSNKKRLEDKQKVINIVNQAIVDYDRTGRFAIEVEDTTLLQEVINDSDKRKIRSILFPLDDNVIYANTKSCVARRTAFYGSLGITLCCLVSNLFTNNVTLNVFIDGISLILNVLTGASLVFNDMNVVEDVTKRINTILDDNSYKKIKKR